MSNGGSLIWDGDSFRNDGFTQIIQNVSYQIQQNDLNHCINKNKLKYLFVTFKREQSVRKGINCWKGRLSQHTPLLIQKVPNSWNDFIKLNMYSLKLSQSDTIIVFGGGKIVKKEYKTIRQQFDANIKFHIYNIKRFNSKTNQYECSQLSVFQNDPHLNLIQRVNGTNSNKQRYVWKPKKSSQ